MRTPGCSWGKKETPTAAPSVEMRPARISLRAMRGHNYGNRVPRRGESKTRGRSTGASVLARAKRRGEQSVPSDGVTRGLASQTEKREPEPYGRSFISNSGTRRTSCRYRARPARGGNAGRDRASQATVSIALHRAFCRSSKPDAQARLRSIGRMFSARYGDTVTSRGRDL